MVLMDMGTPLSNIRDLVEALFVANALTLRAGERPKLICAMCCIGVLLKVLPTLERDLDFVAIAC